MKKLLFLVALTLALFSCKNGENAKNFAVDPAGYDFSEVLAYGSPFKLGIIGEDFTRLQVYYASVTKTDATHYAVKGFSKVWDNVQSFDGVIELKSISKIVPEPDENGEYVTDHVDNHEAYFLECSYSFPQADGEFNGKSLNEIYFKGNKALTDDCYEGADGYDNNQHIGTFTYTNGKETVANWGAWRIPESDDLDQGVGEFVPSEKYRDNGWGTYYNALFNYEEGELNQLIRVNSIFEECRQWWDPEAPKLDLEVVDNHFEVAVTTPAGKHTYQFPSMYPPEYKDINFDGYMDLYQTGDEERHDEGACYLYNPQTKEFENCPSFHDILHVDHLAVFPEEKVLMTSHNFAEKGEFFYYLYRFENGKFVQDGTVMEKDSIFYEYDKDGNLIHQGEYPTDLSRIWGVCFAN